MTDTQTNTFVAKLQADAEKYQDSSAQEEYRAQVREQAAEHFLETYLSGETAASNFEANTLHRNKLGYQTVRLEHWQGGGPAYLDQSLSDLLDVGDLLQRMQDYLDTTYGSGNFRVFNYRVRGSRNRTVSLTVSWNKEGFENVDSIIENNRQRAHEHKQRQQAKRSHGHDDDGVSGDDDEELAPRSRGPPRRSHDDGGRGPPRRRDDGGRAPRRYDDGGRAPRRYDDDTRAPRRYDDGSRGPPRRYEDGSRRAAERNSSRDGGSSGRPSRRRAAMSSYDS